MDTKTFELVSTDIEGLKALLGAMRQWLNISFTVNDEQAKAWLVKSGNTITMVGDDAVEIDAEQLFGMFRDMAQNLKEHLGSYKGNNMNVIEDAQARAGQLAEVFSSMELLFVGAMLPRMLKRALRGCEIDKAQVDLDAEPEPLTPDELKAIRDARDRLPQQQQAMQQQVGSLPPQHGDKDE